MPAPRLRFCGTCGVHSPVYTLQPRSQLSRHRPRQRISCNALDSGCVLGLPPAAVLLDKISCEYPLMKSIGAGEIGCKGSVAVRSSGSVDGRRLYRASSWKNSDAFQEGSFDRVNPSEGSGRPTKLRGSTEARSLTTRAASFNGWKPFDDASFDYAQTTVSHKVVDQQQSLRSGKLGTVELFEDADQIPSCRGKSTPMPLPFYARGTVSSGGDRHMVKYRGGLKKQRNPEARTKALSSGSHEDRRPNKTKHQQARHGFRFNLHKQQHPKTKRLLPGRDRSDFPERSAAVYSGDPISLFKTRDDDKERGAHGDRLERFAIRESEQTTRGIQSCVKLAESINGDLVSTLTTLHRQGEQITRAHELTLDIDQDLGAGEKLLGSLGGNIFSRRWKPKKSLVITGPVIDRQASFQRRKNHVVPRRSLDLSGINRKEKTDVEYSKLEPEFQSTQMKLESEQKNQDEGLSSLSDALSLLKRNSLDMGKELSRQNEALNPFQAEVMELSRRVRRANARGRYLLLE